MRNPLGFCTIRGNHYCRVRIPKDLIEAYEGKRELKVSLNTRDYAVGRSRCLVQMAKFDQDFAAARAQLKREASAATASLSELKTLARNYVDRRDAETRQQALDFDMSDTDEVQRAMTECREAIDNLKSANHGLTVEEVSRIATELLKHPDGLKCLPERDRRDGYDVLRRSLLEIERRALATLKQDYSKKSFDLEFATAAGTSLGQLVELYEKQRRTNGTKLIRQEKVSSALQLIIRYFGAATPIATITPLTCTGFRNTLIALPSNLRKRFSDEMPLVDVVKEAERRGLPLLASGTQETYLTTLKSLFEFAQSQWLIDRNPTVNLAAAPPEVHATERRRPFSGEDLARIFLSREFVQAAKSRFVVSREATRFWVPLIAAFSGMRVNEICQLHASDVRCSTTGVHFIAVNDDGDKALKNAYSKRDMPLHPDLLGLGFLDYVSAVQRLNAARLFPDLRYHDKGNYGPDLSKWFNRLLPRWIDNDERKSFHSFRHAFGDAMRVAHVPDRIAARLGGWVMEKGSQGHYGGEAYNADNLAIWINKLRYEKLDVFKLL